MLTDIIADLTLQLNQAYLPYKSKHVAAVLHKRGLCTNIRL